MSGLVSRSAVEDFLERDFESFLWLKRLTRKQLERQLDELRVPPRFKTEPWLHQLVCFYIALCYPRFLFLLDMGLGKSKILLDVMTQLYRERAIKRGERALITVPRLMNIDSWMEDAERHCDLEPWPVNQEDIEAKRELLLNPKGEFTLIDYQGLHWALCLKKKGRKKGSFSLTPDPKLLRYFEQAGYSFLGIDESHKLGNPDSLWYALMQRISEQSRFVYATTGTLFSHDKNLEAIWSQFYLVDQGETFGSNLALFRAAFYEAKAGPFKVEYQFKKKLRPALRRMLQHRSIRYDEDEVLDLPARMPPITVRLDMMPDQREHYLRAVEGLINANGKLSELDGAWVRMRQICSGYLQWTDEHGDHLVHFKTNPKLDAIERLVDEMGDSKIVLCYDYTETGRLISERMSKLGLDHEWYYGGTKDKSGSRRRFMEDPSCRVFVMNSEAGGTGNDGLQKVARYMVFVESPPNPITRQQTIKRIHRSGQTKRTFFYDLCMLKSVEVWLLAEVKAGRDLYESVVSGKVPSRNFLLGVV